MSTSASARITEQDIQTYQVDGAVCIRGLLSPEWIAHMRDAVERTLVAPKGNTNARDIAAEAGKARRFHNESSLWRNNEGYLPFIQESPLAKAAA